MPSIESRLKIAYLYWYDPTRKLNITGVNIFLDGELFLKKKKETVGVHDSRAFAHEVRYSILKGWTCNSKNTSESTFPLTKKVLVASCGNLALQETLKLEQ
ncbi:hypothetical protein K30_025 [Salmonella phage Kenya-K30]|nr:hypothetical protein K30_025 [Salmonella phage Kenya-K30]